MNIVVIDGYTLNPGDLDVSGLKECGNVTFYDRSERSQLVERLKDADIAMVNKVLFDEELVKNLPRLKYIALTATGYNNLHLDVLKKYGVQASNVSNYGNYAVAQHTMALLLEICNRVAHHHQECKEGKWKEMKDFCFWTQPLTELYGKKMGIIGLGHIGMKTAQMAQAFGMQIAYFGRKYKEIEGYEFHDTVESLISSADVVSLHTTLNDETRHLIRKDTLRYFRPHSILLNTARGALVHEDDLLEALDNGQLYAAGLDVLSVEPPENNHPLLHHPRCIVTPHNAWAAKETRQRLLDMGVDNIKSFIVGRPQNLLV